MHASIRILEEIIIRLYFAVTFFVLSFLFYFMCFSYVVSKGYIRKLYILNFNRTSSMQL